MRLSKLGLVLSGVYVALAAILFLYGYSLIDNKSRYVFMQLSVWPVIGLMHVIGLDSVLHSGWINNFPMMFVLNLALVYGIGWALGKLWERSARTLPSAGG